MFPSRRIERPTLPALSVTLSSETPEVLLIHGCAETSAVWLPLMHALSAIGIASAALDLRGHGNSHGHDTLQSYGITDYVTDAHDVFPHFPSLRVSVGHSMGGLITQLLAAERQIDHAILIASSPVCGMKADGMRMARKHFWTFLMASLQRSFQRLYQNESVTRSLLFHPNTPASLIRQFMSHKQEDSWRAGNEMNTLLPAPTAVRCPITVIGGKDDFMVSRASTEATARAYKTEAIYFDNCAHMVPLEADPTQLASIIQDALRPAPHRPATSAHPPSAAGQTSCDTPG